MKDHGSVAVNVSKLGEGCETVKQSTAKPTLYAKVHISVQDM
jgi:hypothetical protein